MLSSVSIVNSLDSRPHHLSVLYFLMRLCDEESESSFICVYMYVCMYVDGRERERVVESSRE